MDLKNWDTCFSLHLDSKNSGQLITNTWNLDISIALINLIIYESNFNYSPESQKLPWKLYRFYKFLFTSTKYMKENLSVWWIKKAEKECKKNKAEETWKRENEKHLWMIKISVANWTIKKY